MRVPVSIIAAGASLVGLGLGAGYLIAPGSKGAVGDQLARLERRLDEIADLASSSRPLANGPITCAAIVDSESLAAAVRRALREVSGGGGVLRDPPSAGEDEARAQSPTPPSSEALAAYAQSRQIITDARRARVWAQEQADRLHLLLPQLAQVHREEVERELIQSINNQELQMKVAGSPF